MPAIRREPVADQAIGKRRDSRVGGKGVAHTQISGIQRARMLSAMCEAATECGAANVTVAHVVARSGVSRRTFYEIFEDRDDCFLATLDQAVARASEYLLDAPNTLARWVDRMRASLLALLEFLDDEPRMGRLLVVESLGAGPAALERRSRALARLIAGVEAGEEKAKEVSGSSPLTAEGVVGAVFSVIHGRMLESKHPAFVTLLKPLMAMIVLPYLGAGVSRRELARTTPGGRERVKSVPLDPLSMLDMRLTYRTARVLLAIGSYPGSSNRAIADIADVGDPGQMSKLLARLRHLGLIENVEVESARGVPNAWRLTTKGKEIARAIAAQTSRC